MSELRFDEAQAAEIFQRAAQLQSADAADGATLDQLKKIASEVGIDPALVEQAATEVNTKLLTPVTSDQGVVTLFERNINDELSASAWEDIIATLRSYTGATGTVSQDGATKEWQCRTGTVGITFSTTVRAGRTRFRLIADTSPLGYFWGTVRFGGAFMGGAMTFGLMGALHIWQLSVLSAAAVVFASIFGTRFMAKRGRNQIQAELNQVMDSIARIGSTKS
ncbi:MAG: hypothetical protein JSS72_03630 [Armatimonadetes bacterium]|nr:hypothetical protein [Armatimonadota bacterium]